MTTSSLQVESWVPVPVANAAARLQAEFTEQKFEEGLIILLRLISDPRMKAVWIELYSERRDQRYKSTGIYVHSAVTLRSKAVNHQREASALRKKKGILNESAASLLDLEAKAELAAAETTIPGFAERSASSRQDFAVERFLDYACRAATDVVPTYLFEIKAETARVRAVSSILRDQATELCELGFWNEAAELDGIIDQCDDFADLQSEGIDNDDPIIIKRKRGDPKVRAYVTQLYEISLSLFGTPLYGTLARVANVAFGCKNVTRSMVQDWIARAP